MMLLLRLGKVTLLSIWKYSGLSIYVIGLYAVDLRQLFACHTLTVAHVYIYNVHALNLYYYIELGPNAKSD